VFWSNQTSDQLYSLSRPILMGKGLNDVDN